MRRRLLAASFVVGALVGAGALAVIWAISDDASTAGGGETTGGRVEVNYEPGPREATELIKRSGLFEDVAATVNSELALQSDLTVEVIGPKTARKRGVLGPTYDPEADAVYFPWGFVESSHDDLVDPSQGAPRHARGDAVLGNAMAYVLYHELAHGLFEQLDVPIVAGEERSADSLATVLSVVADRRGRSLPLSIAELGIATAEQGGSPSAADYANDHGFDRQRAFDALCAVYGSDPDRFGYLLRGKNALPPTRAELCQFDYERTVDDWRRILAAHLTPQGGLLPPGQ